MPVSFRDVNGQQDCKLFVFPESSLKLYHHFAPNTTDSQGTTVYVDQTAILKIPCPDHGFDYWGYVVGSRSTETTRQECGKYKECALLLSVGIYTYV